MTILVVTLFFFFLICKCLTLHLRSSCAKISTQGGQLPPGLKLSTQLSFPNWLLSLCPPSLFCILSIFVRPGFLFPFSGIHLTAAFVIDSWSILKTCFIHLILLSLMMFSIFSCWVRCLSHLRFCPSMRRVESLRSHRWCAASCFLVDTCFIGHVSAKYSSTAFVAYINYSQVTYCAYHTVHLILLYMTLGKQDPSKLRE